MSDEKESLTGFILRMNKDNRIVFRDLDGFTSVDLDEWLDSQPVPGILYDLNRLPEQANMEDDTRGVNDFAVGLVITRLHERCIEKDDIIKRYKQALEKIANSNLTTTDHRASMYVSQLRNIAKEAIAQYHKE